MIDFYARTLENFPRFLEKCKIDVSCFAIQLFKCPLNLGSFREESYKRISEVMTVKRDLI